jgi:hypothetical protein
MKHNIHLFADVLQTEHALYRKIAEVVYAK